MYALLVYCLKVGACLAVFYLFFKLLLSRETFHRLNRIVVLSAVVLSFLLPLCVITIYREVPAMPEIRVNEEAEYGLPAQPQPEPFPWDRAAAVVFLVGAGATLLRTLGSVCGVMRMIRRGRRERMADGAVLVRTDLPVKPFSWCRYIVLSEKDLAENGEAIVMHEKAHLRLRHSVDLLVTDIAGCLQWFNPAMWLLRRELRAIHEYEADEAVLDSGVDAKQYQLLLIRKAAGGRWYSVANSFNHSKLKNRITMMLRKRSSRWAVARVFLLLPLTGLALGVFARTAYVFPEDKGTKENGAIRIEGSEFHFPDNKPLILLDGKEVETLDSLSNDRIESITVLKDASSTASYGQRGKDGVLLVTTKKSNGKPEARTEPSADGAEIAVLSGTIGDLRITGSSTIARGDGDGGSAVRQFAYAGDEGKMSVTVSGDDTRSKVRVTHRLQAADPDRVNPDLGVDESGNILWIIDGKESSVRSSDELNYDEVASVNVLKGKSAEEKYPGRGLDGVVEITTKAGAARGTAKGRKHQSVRVQVTTPDNKVMNGNTALATEAGLKAAEAGIEAARAGLEAARRHMSAAEWKKAQAELDKAQRELASARKLSAEELAAAREQMQAVREYMASDEWKQAQKQIQQAQEQLADPRVQAALAVAGDAAKVSVSVETSARVADHMQKTDESGMMKGSALVIRGTDKNPYKKGEEPLLVIDGKVCKDSRKLKELGTQIESMTILKDATAVEKYGRKARYGAVEVTTKKK